MFSKILRILAISIVGLTVCSCTSEEEFKKLAAALKAHPELRAEMVKRCIGKPLDWNAETREVLGTLVPVADAKHPAVICERYVNGIASGRLSLTDVQKFRQADMTPTMARVLRGS